MGRRSSVGRVGRGEKSVGLREVGVVRVVDMLSLGDAVSRGWWVLAVIALVGCVGIDSVEVLTRSVW